MTNEMNEQNENQSNEYKITEQARLVLMKAVEAATDLEQNYIGTEHILIGLVSVPCVVKDVLESHEITRKRVVELIKSLIALSDEQRPGKKIQPKWTPRALAIRDIARDKARRGGSEVIGTEHLMMAIISQEDSAAMRLLRTMNIKDEKFVVDLLRAMGEDGLPYVAALNQRHEMQATTQTLDRFSRDLTALAATGGLGKVIGREKELDRLIRTLSRKTKNNPCLIGEPGVGKTAIVEKLADALVTGAAPETIAGKRLLSLDLAAMVAGTKFRGEFEERIERVIKEASSAGNVILFLDEIHTLIGAGGAEGSLDAANILKPALSRGEIQIIGATTVDEYRKHIEKDAALERRFQPLMVEEPSVEETTEILMGIAPKFSEHHGVEITDDAMRASASMAKRYVSDRFLPDKAIDLLDEACAKVSLEYASASASKKRKKGMTAVVDEADIAGVVSDMTKIPVNKLTESESSRLKKLEDELHKRVISQDEAVSAVARAVRRGRVGLKDPKRPIGSFLFLGPTGVGKTELARTLAQSLFGRDDAMIRVDMSEYMEQHSVSKIIGSPPGYVGYDEGGQLSEKVRRNPYCVVLFDEIEKAHHDIFHILLQILDEGKITDAQGRNIDFKNTIIIMTSNAGAERIIAPKKLGFSADESEEADYKKMKDGVMDEVKRLFKPELINRIDEIIVFHALAKADIKRILNLQLKEVVLRAHKTLGITLKITPSFKAYIMEKGYDPKYGARPLRRAIQTELEDNLSIEVLGGEIKSGDTVTVSYDSKIGEVIFK